MRTELTQAEIASYRDNGFLVVESFLDDQELERWRTVVADAIRRRDGRRFSGETTLADLERKPREELTQEEAYYLTVFDQWVNLWQSDDRVRELVLDIRLGRMAAAMAGVDGVRLWHDQALVKQPYANVTAYHLDVPYWSFTSPDALTFWVALDDATAENGCLYYVPGSHKAEKYDNVSLGQGIGALFEHYPEWRDVPAVSCPVPAGGVLVHNGLTFHGAGANMTPRARRAMTFGWMPDGSTFNGRANILPPSYLATLEVGDPLDDDRHNPLVYRRSG